MRAHEYDVYIFLLYFLFNKRSFYEQSFDHTVFLSNQMYSFSYFYSIIYQFIFVLLFFHMFHLY